MAVEIYDSVGGQKFERAIAMHVSAQRAVGTHALPIKAGASADLHALMARANHQGRKELRRAENVLTAYRERKAPRESIEHAKARVREAKRVLNELHSRPPKIGGRFADIDYHVYVDDRRSSRSNMYYDGYHGGRRARNVLTDNL